MSATTERLMDLAERRIREAGYHGFSFREIAAGVGITSASFHHHFPTKPEMVVAIVRRYHDRFFADLVAPTAAGARAGPIALYRSVFRNCFSRDGGMCLIGMLGSESGGLPIEVSEETEQFFRSAVDDLSTRLGGDDAERRAFAVLATLEGGLVLARVWRDIGIFDAATAGLI